MTTPASSFTRRRALLAGLGLAALASSADAKPKIKKRKRLAVYYHDAVGVCFTEPPEVLVDQHLGRLGEADADRVVVVDGQARALLDFRLSVRGGGQGRESEAGQQGTAAGEGRGGSSHGGFAPLAGWKLVYQAAARAEGENAAEASSRPKRNRS